MSGYIHTVIGPMFSGKTSFMLHELERLSRSGKRVVLFSGDSREETPVIHSRRPIHPAIHVEKTRDPGHLFLEGAQWDVIGVDEIQFWPPDIVPTLSELASMGKIVFVAGLDQDYLMKPFMTTLSLLPHSEKITRLTSVCQKCGSMLAIRNFRKVKSSQRVLEGASEIYEARCRCCMQVPWTRPPEE